VIERELRGLKGKNVLKNPRHLWHWTAYRRPLAEFGADVAITYRGRPEDAPRRAAVEACVAKVHRRA
jgi:hypothetical protein